ncbi:hypothetical protein PCE1_002797 [Barthelona sp. PCE]
MLHIEKVYKTNANIGALFNSYGVRYFIERDHSFWELAKDPISYFPEGRGGGGVYLVKWGSEVIGFISCRESLALLDSIEVYFFDIPYVYMPDVFRIFLTLQQEFGYLAVVVVTPFARGLQKTLFFSSEFSKIHKYWIQPYAMSGSELIMHVFEFDRLDDEIQANIEIEIEDHIDELMLVSVKDFEQQFPDIIELSPATKGIFNMHGVEDVLEAAGIK